jgi:hypothetical protein
MYKYIPTFNFGDFLDDLNHLSTTMIRDTSTSYFGDLVDRTRYDVIEKPEWKKKRLQGEVNACKSLIDFFQQQIDNYLQQKQNEENKLSALQNELNSL